MFHIPTSSPQIIKQFGLFAAICFTPLSRSHSPSRVERHGCKLAQPEQERGREKRTAGRSGWSRGRVTTAVGRDAPTECRVSLGYRLTTGVQVLSGLNNSIVLKLVRDSAPKSFS